MIKDFQQLVRIAVVKKVLVDVNAFVCCYQGQLVGGVELDVVDLRLELFGLENNYAALLNFRVLQVALLIPRYDMIAILGYRAG